MSDVLRSGNEMIVAGYCMYAASANIVLTTGYGLNGFTLDSALGEFILTHPNVCKHVTLDDGERLTYVRFKYLNLEPFTL